MWVQLLVCKQIHTRGKPENKRPGDWVNVPRKAAEAMIARREALVMDYSVIGKDLVDCGVSIRGDLSLAKSRLTGYSLVLEIAGGEGLQWEKNLLWDTAAPLRLELLHVGFHLLDTWQIAIPLRDYKLLAAHFGSEAEQERTKTLIRDLRVPVYDTRLMFARRCDGVQELLDLWRTEQHDGETEELAFLRALYQVKPLILALPVTWTDPGYDPGGN